MSPKTEGTVSNDLNILSSEWFCTLDGFGGVVLELDRATVQM